MKPTLPRIREQTEDTACKLEDRPIDLFPKINVVGFHSVA